MLENGLVYAANDGTIMAVDNFEQVQELKR